MKEKRYLVAGTGISGIGAAALLLQMGAKVTMYDGNAAQDRQEVLTKIADALAGKKAGTENVGKESIGTENVGEADIVQSVGTVFGELPQEVLDTIDVMILSPGIAIDAPFVNQVRRKGITIWGEVELAYRASKGRLIGITGTNGKTTTTALTGEIMHNYFESSFVVGNIGIPYTNIALETREDTVTVAEISSFQLETIDTFHPVVTAVLNITPDHLNRHYTMENYANVKMSITKNQTADEVCVLNYEDPILREQAKTLHNRVLFFSSKTALEEGICLKGEEILYRNAGEETVICKVHEMKLVGIHNVENVMAAAGLALCMQVPVEVIRETIRNFNAVEHRIEFVTTKHGVTYYNDSKGTNTDASIKAIEAMTKPTLLIAGGYDKGAEYDDWFEAFGGRIKKLILLGATKEKIAQTAKKHGYEEVVMVDTLEQAVEQAAALAKEGDVVLLSPACASWDMFKSYEQRGKLFKEYVWNLE